MDEKFILAWINSVRKSIGLSPIRRIHKGYRANARSCPIARSLIFSGDKTDYLVSVAPNTVLPNAPYHARISDKDGFLLRWFILPSQVSEFIRKFDEGKFPEYERKMRKERV